MHPFDLWKRQAEPDFSIGAVPQFLTAIT